MAADSAYEARRAFAERRCRATTSGATTFAMYAVPAATVCQLSMRVPPSAESGRAATASVPTAVTVTATRVPGEPSARPSSRA